MKNIIAKKTLVFIDDSGDPGFKFDKGSSNFFVISAVIFDDSLEAEKMAVAIKDLRRNLKFPEDNFEFKFAHSSKEVREKFLSAVSKFNFRIRFLIVDKRIIRSDELKNNKNSFYGYIIKTLLKYSNNSILEAKVKIDGSGDRVFRKSFASYLKNGLNSSQKKVIKKLELVDSKKNVLIQLADMVAGAEFRYFEYANSKKDFAMYRNIFKQKIEDEWQFK